MEEVLLPKIIKISPCNLPIPLLHTDVSVRACTSCMPFLITSKE